MEVMDQFISTKLISISFLNFNKKIITSNKFRGTFKFSKIAIKVINFSQLS